MDFPLVFKGPPSQQIILKTRCFATKIVLKTFKMCYINNLIAKIFSKTIISDYMFIKDRLFAALNLSDKEMFLYDYTNHNLFKTIPNEIILSLDISFFSMKEIPLKTPSYPGGADWWPALMHLKTLIKTKQIQAVVVSNLGLMKQRHESLLFITHYLQKLMIYHELLSPQKTPLKTPMF